MSELFSGREKEAVIEIFRTLDLFRVMCMSKYDVAEVVHLRAYYARCGVAEALVPFMEKTHAGPLGVPWGKSNDAVSALIESYLVECGKIVDLLRLVRLSAHGVVSIFVSHRYIEISAMSDVREQFAPRLFHVNDQGKLTDVSLPSEAVKNRMREYVRPDPSYRIAYDSDEEVVLQHKQLARRFRSIFPGAEAIPDGCLIGGRPFSEWREECEGALGRILAHINFCLLLCEARPKTKLRDVLTSFCSKADAVAVMEDTGQNLAGISEVLKALTLEPAHLADWASIYETPASQYVSLDESFVLISCSGMLGNPYYSMFRYLRSCFRKDWDRAVDARENVFRKEIGLLFPSSRYTVPDHGYKLRRIDGSHITDIDAIVCDRMTGSIALVQLKWHDPYGRSIAERESRRKNLARASKWVENVERWVGGRTCAEISAELCLPISASQHQPEILVVARYAAQFVKDDRKSEGATWISWPELNYLLEFTKEDPIRELRILSVEALANEDCVSPYTTTFKFGDLDVTLTVGDSCAGG
ncbi:hypothetical protein [Stenotrophomonas acidaminiphila]|uniref:hypothetical protein n=1 Tax=Stenotrophomonas acidaminiphila TaxID=128780 RepID=UPI0028A62A73|nr:hypothetical protein [Stenotrophomonas acidaminiphila]